MRGKRRAAMGAGTVLASVLAWWACGPGNLGDLTAGSHDAGNDADRCRALGVPPPPSISDPIENRAIRFAVQNIRLDLTDVIGAPPPLSLNLDLACTCPTEPGSCTAPVGSPSPRCDDEQGRDNAAAILLSQNQYLQPVSNYVASIFRKGRVSILLEVTGWSGGDDDPSVALFVRLSTGIASVADGGTTQPRFDGTDEWLVDVESLKAGAQEGKTCDEQLCEPAIQKATGYVAGGQLVARDLDLPIVISGPQGPLRIELHGAVVVARLASGDGGIHTIERGELTGRWPTSAFLSGLAGIREPITNRSLCKGHELYESIRSDVCKAADIAADPARDGKPLPCDAVSTSISFTAVEAKYGAVARSPRNASDCPDASDRCD